MSNFKTMIRRYFNEAADEQNLFSADQQALLANLERSISANEVKILEGMVYSRAERLNCRPDHVRMALECMFEIEELGELPSDQFEDAMDYLTHFRGTN